MTTNSVRSGNAKKVISRLSKIKLENSTISMRTTRFYRQRTTSYATTSSASNLAYWNPKASFLSHRQTSTSLIHNQIVLLHKAQRRPLQWHHQQPANCKLRQHKLSQTWVATDISLRNLRFLGKLPPSALVSRKKQRYGQVPDLDIQRRDRLLSED